MDLRNAVIIKSSYGEEMLRRFFRVSLEEINNAKQRYPDKADLLHKAMKLTTPTMENMQDSDDVYRSHVREMLARVVAGEDTRPATKAEILCVLTAYIAERNVKPIIGNLIYRLAAEVFGNDDERAEVAAQIAEHRLLGSAINRVEDQLREELACPVRTL